MTDEDKIIYGALATVGVAFLALVWWGVGVRRRAEANGLSLKAAEVALAARDSLLGPTFIWGTWQDLLSARQFQLHIRDEHNRPLTIITKFQIPKAGVLRSFDWQGATLECVKEGMWSNRTFLRDAASGHILLSCRHGHRRDVIYRGDSDHEICRLAYGSILKPYRPILIEGQKIGRIGNVQELDAHIRFISVRGNRLSALEQLFVMASV